MANGSKYILNCTDRPAGPELYERFISAPLCDTKAEKLNLNPFLISTAAPPIPEAKAWAAGYDGSAGPLIDLSQAVPGYPPHPGLLQANGRSGGVARGGGLWRYRRRRGICGCAYADHVSALYGADIAPGEVAITAGCNQAFFVAALALAKAGDAVLLPTPWYFNHKMALDMLGIEAVAASLPRRKRLCAGCRRRRATLIERRRARHRPRHAEQPDRRRLSARDDRGV